MYAVLYSIAFGDSEQASKQLAASVRSLRMLDRNIDVHIFYFGHPPAGFLEVVSRFDVATHDLGDYSSYINDILPEIGKIISFDPKLHRWFVLGRLELAVYERVLYVDSDTVFLSNASDLFERYNVADFYAREEPFSRRSALGYEPSYVDESAMEALRAQAGLKHIEPFNTGVFLASKNAIEGICSVLTEYASYLMRFFSGFSLSGMHNNSMNSSIQAISHPLFDRSAFEPLPYPSNNTWIVDQVAMWLALGNLTIFSQGDFDQLDVWQGPEYVQASEFTCLPILTHYYSSNQDDFFHWLQRFPANPLR